MKIHNLFIASGVVAAALTIGNTANAVPLRGGSHYTHVYQTQHVQSGPRHVAHHGGGHHHGHHSGGHTVVVTHQPHRHYHSNAGNIILATALLVSAFM